MPRSWASHPSHRRRATSKLVFKSRTSSAPAQPGIVTWRARHGGPDDDPKAKAAEVKAALDRVTDEADSWASFVRGLGAVRGLLSTARAGRGRGLRLEDAGLPGASSCCLCPGMEGAHRPCGRGQARSRQAGPCWVRGPVGGRPRPAHRACSAPSSSAVVVTCTAAGRRALKIPGSRQRAGPRQPSHGGPILDAIFALLLIETGSGQA